MPRKLSEWREMRDSYFKARRSNYHLDGNAIVYDWASTNAFWESIRQHELGYLTYSKAIFDNNFTGVIDLGNRIIAQGQAERAKELEFIHKALPDFEFKENNINGDIIKAINRIIRGKKQFKYALERMRAAIKDSKATDHKNLGPSASSLFTSYLGTQLSKLFYDFAGQAKIQDPFSAWTTYLQTHLDEAIDGAFRVMTEEIGTKDEVNPIYGDAKQWREVGEAYRSIAGYAEEFRSMIKSKINFNELANMFQNEGNREIYRKARSGNRKSGFRTFADEKLHLKTQAGQRGGSVSEYVEDLIKRIAPTLVTVSDKGSAVLRNETITADSVALYTFSADIGMSMQQLVEELNASLDGTSGAVEGARRLQEFYDRNLSKLDDTFIVYESDKMYKLDNNFSGFHNGGNHPLKQLGDYIAEAGISAEAGMDFVKTAYNTLQTAVYEGSRDEIQEQITNILMAAAAKLLFSDWATVGVRQNSGAKALHVLNLDGFLIPSSYLLTKLGVAMKNAAKDTRKWFAVTVHLPETVVYTGKSGKLGANDKEIKDALYKLWKDQYNKAEQESYFSVKFLSNFKSIVDSSS